MSDSAYRTQCKAIVTDLQTNVTQLATSGNNPPVAHYSEPMTYPADGPHLAVWYEGEQLAQTNPTGNRLYAETYHVKYWEPDFSRDTNLVVDEDAQNDMENLYRAVLDRFLVGTVQFPTGDSTNRMKVVMGQAQLAPGGSINQQGAFIRGFEAIVVVSRWRALT